MDLLIYTIAALVLLAALLFVNKTRCKFIVITIYIWLVIGNVITPIYYDYSDNLPFFIPRIDRIVFIALCMFLLVKAFLTNKIPLFKSKYEVLLIVLLVATSITLTYHAILESNVMEYLPQVVSLMTFCVMYVSIKSYIDENGMIILGKSILYLAVFSSIIGIFQFFINTDILRYNKPRPAFGHYFRSCGVFPSDHIQVYYLIPAYFIVLHFFRRGILKKILQLLLVAGILLTFHRMGMVIFFLFNVIYLFKITRIKPKYVFAMTGIALAFTALWFAMPGVSVGVKSSSLFQDRLSENTLAYRMKFNKIAQKGIQKRPFFGIGSFKRSDYQSDVYEAGYGNETVTEGLGGIHNSFLYIAYLNGIIVGSTFILFLLIAFAKYWKLKEIKQIFILVAFAVLEILIAGLSNAILIGSEIGLLFAIILGMGAAIEENTLDKVLAKS